MLQYSIRRIEAGVNERISQHGLMPEDLDLDQLFNNVNDPFEGLKTVYMQEKFYSDYLGCIVSTFNACRFICYP